MGASTEDVAQTLIRVRQELPVAPALDLAHTVDEAVRRAQNLAVESTNSALKEAVIHFVSARDALRRAAGHWGAVDAGVTEYLIASLGVEGSMTTAVPTSGYSDPEALSSLEERQQPRGVSKQKQARHVLGTREYAERIRSEDGGSAFFDAESAHRLTMQTWFSGTPSKRPYVRDRDFGVPVGVSSSGRYQTRVRVHLDRKGRLHGHPSGPEISRDSEPEV